MTLKVKSKTDEMVVIGVESEDCFSVGKGHRRDDFANLDVVRVYKDRVELVMQTVDGKVTKKFYFADMLEINHALFRINHPQIKC